METVYLILSTGPHLFPTESVEHFHGVSGLPLLAPTYLRPSTDNVPAQRITPPLLAPTGPRRARGMPLQTHLTPTGSPFRGAPETNRMTDSGALLGPTESVASRFAGIAAPGSNRTAPDSNRGAPRSNRSAPGSNISAPGTNMLDPVAVWCFAPSRGILPARSPAYPVPHFAEFPDAKHKRC